MAYIPIVIAIVFIIALFIGIIALIRFFIRHLK